MLWEWGPVMFAPMGCLAGEWRPPHYKAIAATISIRKRIEAPLRFDVTSCFITLGALPSLTSASSANHIPIRTAPTCWRPDFVARLRYRPLGINPLITSDETAALSLAMRTSCHGWTHESASHAPDDGNRGEPLAQVLMQSYEFDRKELN